MARIERVLADGQRNVWLYGDDLAAVVIDPTGALPDVERALGERELSAIVCTSAAAPVVEGALALRERHSADLALPASDRELWERRLPGLEPQVLLSDGVVLQAGGTVLRAISTPGVTPGAVCLYDGDGHLFTGTTLTDRGTEHAIVRERLLRLPPETVALSAGGESFTIGAALAQGEPG